MASHICGILELSRLEKRTQGKMRKLYNEFLIGVMKAKVMLYLSSAYFVNQPLHVSGIFVTHHQEVYCIYTATGTCCLLAGLANRQSTEKHNT